MKDQTVNSDASRFAEITEAVCQRLAKNERVRRTLPGKGRLRVDRQLPFLCVYRRPRGNDVGTQELVTSEAAYLFASGKPQYHPGVSVLCSRIISSMEEHFGTFLLLEIWAEEPASPLGELTPGFELVTPEAISLPDTVNSFTASLSRISIRGRRAEVTTRTATELAPPGLQPLSPSCSPSGSGGCVTLGLAVRPIYRNSRSGTLYPMLLASLRSQLARSLRRAIAEFTGYETAGKQAHFESLGPTSFVKAARLIDQQLCEVSESFDFLLQVTPTNSEEAWQEFQDKKFREPPRLQYRPLPYHPNLLKRRLFEIEIERIEDPTLAHLFWDKQTELDRQLSAMRDLQSPRFLPSSLQLYGSPDSSLVELAEALLNFVPEEKAECEDVGCLPVDEIIARAREEIDYYHQQMPAFNATVEISNQIASGIMVSQDRLLISENVRLSPARLEPLLHHEIGTHLLTYFNGRCQPFRQLYAGLAGYEELQEGLAVLAEYLSGGLSSSRLKTLASRVIAARCLMDRLSFVETFHQLTEQYGVPRRSAFVTTLRVYRAGGFTKDIIYLRGFRDVLDYLDKGHEIEPLYVGKLGLQHLPYIQEMRRRGIIKPPGLLPRLWDHPEFRTRLEACRGRSVVQLLETSL